MIYNMQASRVLLGCLLNNPQLLLNDKYILENDDFSENIFHKTLFRVILYLAKKGAKDISSLDVGEVVENYEAEKEILEDSEYMDFINVVKDIANEENVDIYYEVVKKLSVLREYHAIGFPIHEFYDINTDEDKSTGKSAKDVIEYFDGIQISLNRKFKTNTTQEEYQAGTDFAETKERMKKEPLVGDSFQSEYLNSIFRGMYGFIIRAAKSGGGKTVLSIGDICKVTCTQYWDYNKQKFVDNPSCVGSSLFINTEMDLRNELDVIIISWISGVSRDHILNGEYDEGEEERVDKANEILIESKLYIVDDPSFTTKSLISTIRDYAINKGIKNVCFDYIQNNGFVAKELSSETKVPQREDMVLLTLTDRLKQVQRECGIGVISSVQTNGTEDNMAYPTESCLAGGKSQVRKTDGTMCMLPPTKQELEQTRLLFKRKGFGEHMEPNNVIHIIKGRANQYPKHIKIFQYMDLGTGRTYDLYCTDKNNQPFKVKKLIIENNK